MSLNQTALRVSKPPLAAVFVSAITLVIALALTPDRLTAANHALDGGDLLAAVLSNGIAHPSGYPTYLLLGELAQAFPFGTPYWRGALLSSIPAALAAGLMVLLVTCWMGDKKEALVSGLAAGLAWGTAPAFLSQAVIVEVHGLQALFSILALWWVILLYQYTDDLRTNFALLGLGLVFGIGLGNHLTLIFFLPVIAFFLLHAWRRGMRRSLIAGQAGLVTVGLLVYLFLPLQARAYPPVNWGNPQTWEGFSWLVFAQPYQELVFALADISLGSRILAWFNLFREQFGLIGLCIGAAGASLMIDSEKLVSGILAWVVTSYSLFAIGYSTADSAIYLIPSYMAFAVWIAYAIKSTWDLRWRTIPWGKLIGAMTLLYLLVRIPATCKAIDPRSATWPDMFAVELLKTAPANALILTASDPDTFSLWYHHFGLGERPDLALVAGPLTQFGWYQQTLSHTYPHLNFPDQTQGLDNSWVETLTRLNDHLPVCRTFVSPGDPSELKYVCQTSGTSSVLAALIS